MAKASNSKAAGKASPNSKAAPAQSSPEKKKLTVTANGKKVAASKPATQTKKVISKAGNGKAASQASTGKAAAQQSKAKQASATE